jgi:hypothetical protein
VGWVGWLGWGGSRKRREIQIQTFIYYIRERENVCGSGWVIRKFGRGRVGCREWGWVGWGGGRERKEIQIQTFIYYIKEIEIGCFQHNTL